MKGIIMAGGAGSDLGLSPVICQTYGPNYEQTSYAL